MLAVEGLVVEYGPVRAVRGASLHVETGEVVGLIGANGAGKTSTLQAVLGLVPAAAGTVTLDGQPLNRLASSGRMKAGLALVPQGRQMFGGLSVADNLRAGGWIRRPGPRPTVEELLADFPALTGKLRQQAGTLSGGEQQMLALARALAGRPTCLLLDEPSMGLSPLLIDRVAGAIKDLAAQRGITMLIVDQGLGIVRKTASRVYVMAHGQIVDEVGADELDEGRAVERAYFG
jgi:branched-chain amino acid transport system ATP-binding protein